MMYLTSLMVMFLVIGAPLPTSTNIADECSEGDGFFKIPESGNQCFKYFTDTARSWYASQAKCDDEGLVLAMPKAPVALREHIHVTFGNTHSWIDGRGRGSTVYWVRDGTLIPSSESVWWPAYPTCCDTTTHCLAMFGHWYGLRTFPLQPYYMNNCSASIYPPTDNSIDNPFYALCQVPQ